MSEIFFDKFADIPSLEKQRDQIKAIYGEVRDGILDLSKVGVKIDGSSSIRELSAATKDYDTIVKEVIARKAQYNGSTKELTDLILKQARAEKELAKAALDNAKASDVSTKAKIREAKAAADATSEYLKLSKEYNVLARKSQDRAAQLYKEANGNDVLFKSLLQNDDAYKKITKDALAYDTALKSIDAAVGRNQRSVGDYKKAFDGLSFSFTQVARELPSLAVSTQQFFLAISNNLPIVTDEIRKAKIEIAALKAEGKDAPSLFSRIGKSLLSFNVFMSIGITLLVTYGKEVANWARGLFRASSAVEDYKRQTELLNDVNKEAARSAGQEIAQLSILYKVATNAALAMKDRKKAVDDLQKEYPAYFKNLQDDIILHGQAAFAYDAAKNALLELAKAKAIESKLTEVVSKSLDLDREKIDLTTKQGLAEAYIVKQRAKAAGEGFDPKGMAASVGVETQNLRLLQAEYDGINKKISENTKARQENQKDQEFLLSQATISPVSSAPIASKAIDKAKADKKDAADYEFEIYKIQQERLLSVFKSIYEDENQYSENRLYALDKFITNSAKLRERQFESESKGKQGQELKLLEEKKYADLLKIAEEGEKGILDILKDRAEGEKLVYGQTYQTAKKAADDVAKLEKDNREKRLKDEKDFADKKKALNQKLYQEIQETIFAFIDAGFQREEDALSRKQTLLDREAEAKKNAINASGLTEVERTKQLAAVEKQAAFDREKIEERRRQIAIQRAKFDKAQSIASIIQSTAEAVIAALGSKPYSPANIALATLTGVIGAAQLARAVATPIPQYFKGTDNAKPGLSIVGEIGTEMGIEPSGKVFLTPATPTLMNLSGGEKILPHNITKDILNAVGMTHLLGLKNFYDVPMSEARINQHLQEKMLGELQDLNKKSRIVINNQLGIESSAYYLNNLKN